MLGHVRLGPRIALSKLKVVDVIEKIAFAFT